MSPSSRLSNDLTEMFSMWFSIVDVDLTSLCTMPCTVLFFRNLSSSSLRRPSRYSISRLTRAAFLLPISTCSSEILRVKDAIDSSETSHKARFSAPASMIAS